MPEKWKILKNLVSIFQYLSVVFFSLDSIRNFYSVKHTQKTPQTIKSHQKSNNCFMNFNLSRKKSLRISRANEHKSSFNRKTIICEIYDTWSFVRNQLDIHTHIIPYRIFLTFFAHKLKHAGKSNKFNSYSNYSYASEDGKNQLRRWWTLTMMTTSGNTRSGFMLKCCPLKLNVTIKISLPPLDRF